jgi:hypothetical protein
LPPMPRHFRALLALVAVAALVALSGCGSSDDSKSDSTSSGTTSTATSTSSSSGDATTQKYKADAQKVANDFKTSAQSASEQTQSATDTAGKIKGLEALKKSVTDAADGFEGLTPPANAKSLNNELVSEFRALAGNVDQVEQALKTQDKAAAQNAVKGLQSNQAKITKTINELESLIGQ